jgi:uracil-DNA glycosylase
MKNAIFIIGEAYGEREEIERAPFVGPSGYLLTRMLDEAGIERANCFLTNVFNLRPADNKIEALCGPKEEAIRGFPSLGKGKYVQAQYIPELERLGEEVVKVNPNIIIALGNTAVWAMLGKTGISAIRGTTQLSTHTATGYKVLPTFHPAAVIRQWGLRPTVIMDFLKAKREALFPDIRRPERTIWIQPTIEDLHEFKRRYINGCGRCSVDIETAGNQITCIGFAPNPRIALVVPFVDGRRLGKNFWRNAESEQRAWKFVKDILEDKSIRKTFQNGLYDIAFIRRSVGMKVWGAEHDTMLLHHALQPESLKSLGFLGSVYTDEGNWKQMRRVATIKSDD